MKAGKVLKYFIKLAISGILALVILSVFCLFYFNPPMPIPQPEEYSNTKYVENRFWVSFREGFGVGRTNELGYNDAPIRDESAPRIAFIGSSHTVGLQVKQDKIFPCVTESLLLADATTDNDYECMNLGSAGQFFDATVSNVEYLAKSFDNLAYVVIETPTLNYTEDEFEKMLLGEYHVEPTHKDIAYRTAQRIPFLRLMANQYQSVREPLASAPSQFTGNSSEERDYIGYERGFRSVAENLSFLAEKYGFKLIIVHHDSPMIDAEGSFHSAHDSGTLDVLERCCADYGIILLDMCQEFADYAQNGTESAYGFANTRPGIGHLNKNGHSLIAQRLYEIISAAEEVE
ncbi:MAG: hypothetical protein E7420_01765 [Ruminococcaceae bacterium]|nr:hypothetical protein [Oscillospiraceae bacterium]